MVDLDDTLPAAVKAQMTAVLERELVGSFGDEQQGGLWHYTDAAVSWGSWRRD